MGERRNLFNTMWDTMGNIEIRSNFRPAGWIILLILVLSVLVFANYVSLSNKISALNREVGRFEEKIAWKEQQLLDLKEAQKYAPFIEGLGKKIIDNMGDQLNGKQGN